MGRVRSPSTILGCSLCWKATQMLSGPQQGHWQAISPSAYSNGSTTSGDTVHRGHADRTLPRDEMGIDKYVAEVGN